MRPTADEQRVIDAYKAAHPQSRPGSVTHIRLIRRHLADGYTADELVEAINGNKLDAWALEKGKHELTWVLRNRDNIDRYRGECQRQHRPATNGDGGAPASHHSKAEKLYDLLVTHGLLTVGKDVFTAQVAHLSDSGVIRDRDAFVALVGRLDLHHLSTIQARHFAITYIAERLAASPEQRAAS